MQLCIALKRIDEAGYVYRDLKPGNIVIKEYKNGDATSGIPVIRLIDYGFLCLKSEVIKDSGTPGYAPPEIMNNIYPDKKYNEVYENTSYDVYSLGKVIIEMFDKLDIKDPKTFIDYLNKEGKHEIVTDFVKLIITCINEEKSQRPNYEQLIKGLNDFVNNYYGNITKSKSEPVVISDSNNTFEDPLDIFEQRRHAVSRASSITNPNNIINANEVVAAAKKAAPEQAAAEKADTYTLNVNKVLAEHAAAVKADTYTLNVNEVVATAAAKKAVAEQPAAKKANIVEKWF